MIPASAAHDTPSCSPTLQLSYPPDGTDFKYLLELRAEAEYYGLCGLVSQIDRWGLLGV